MCKKCIYWIVFAHPHQLTLPSTIVHHNHWRSSFCFILTLRWYESSFSTTFQMAFLIRFYLVTFVLVVFKVLTMANAKNEPNKSYPWWTKLNVCRQTFHKSDLIFMNSIEWNMLFSWNKIRNTILVLELG